MRDDKSLMAHLKNRDEGALNQVIEKYTSFVSYVVNTVIGQSLPREDREEVVADTFLALWNHAHSLNEAAFPTLKPYLGQTARNLSRNKLRDCNKMVTLEFDECMVSPEMPMDEKLLHEEVRNALKETIMELSPPEQHCFLFYYYFGKNIREIAEASGISQATVKSRLARGRKKSKILLERKGIRDEYEDF